MILTALFWRINIRKGNAFPLCPHTIPHSRRRYIKPQNNNVLTSTSDILDSLLITYMLQLILLKVFSICTSQLRLLSIITPRKLVLFTLTISLIFIRIFNSLSCLHCFVWKRIYSCVFWSDL
jgi:hypothetical protein